MQSSIALYVELYIETFRAGAVPCCSMLAGGHRKMTLDGKMKFLDDKSGGPASL